MLIGFVLHHTGTIENPPVWGEEIVARLLSKELNKKGIATTIINMDQDFYHAIPDYVLYFSSNIPLKHGKTHCLWAQNDWDFKKLGENIHAFDSTYPIIIHYSPLLHQQHPGSYLLRMSGDPELFFPREPSGNFPLCDVVYVSNNIKPWLNNDWIKPLAEYLGVDRFRIYGSVWDNGSGLEKWWHGAPAGLVVPDIYASSKIVLSLHLNEHRQFNVATCRLPEALLSGKPIVSDKVGHDLFDKYIWYCSDSTDVLKHVKTILDDYETAKAIVLSGRDYVLNNHTYAHKAEELLTILSNKRKD